MKYLIFAAVAAAVLIFPTHADEPARAPGEIVDAAPAGEWTTIASSDLLVMDLAPDAMGNTRRIVIQLMSAPFSQGWIGNIRKLAAAHWWDATSVYRVQDNYVTQWGDATDEKTLPEGLVEVAEVDYVQQEKDGQEKRIVPAHPNDYFDDVYANLVKLENGWPIAFDVGDDKRILSRWPVHCYGMVGVARGMSPNTGSGAELYTVIGHAPRHLDRNIALVGRIVSGMEHLSSLPRGTGPLGFYEDPAERVSIKSVRLASDLPAADRPDFEYLSTESESFARYAHARANRRDPFFIKPAGGADICNIPVPVRPVAAK